jgi:hypothetical protein
MTVHTNLEAVAIMAATGFGGSSRRHVTPSSDGMTIARSSGMKKVAPRKLQFASNTLRRLSNDRLSHIAGGLRVGSDSTAGDTSTPEVSCVACSGACSGSPDPG